MLYLELFEICVILALIYTTDFFNEIDSKINKKWKFIHLPKIIMCQNCATWWITLFYTILTGNLCLDTILFCILLWHTAPYVNLIIYLVKDTMTSIINELSKYFVGD